MRREHQLSDPRDVVRETLLHPLQDMVAGAGATDTASASEAT